MGTSKMTKKAFRLEEILKAITDIQIYFIALFSWTKPYIRFLLNNISIKPLKSKLKRLYYMD